MDGNEQARLDMCRRDVGRRSAWSRYVLLSALISGCAGEDPARDDQDDAIVMPHKEEPMSPESSDGAGGQSPMPPVRPSTSDSDTAPSTPRPQPTADNSPDVTDAGTPSNTAGAGGNAGVPDVAGGSGESDGAGGEQSGPETTEQSPAADDQFTIQLDYTYDTVAAFDEQKRRILEYAAQLWSQYIISEFGNIPPGTALRARHPEHIDQEGMVFQVDYEIDDLMLIVGYAPVDGIHGALGWTSSSFTYQVEDAELLAELELRYEGPIYQPWIAQITFDHEEEWYFDDTPETADDLADGLSDFASTAIHEIAHALGFGSSVAYEALVEDGYFVGSRAVEVYGAPVPLSADTVHFARDLLFQGQKPGMEEGTAPGERKVPTALDLAVLDDIGYEIAWDRVP